MDRTVKFDGVRFDSLGLLLTKNPVPPCSTQDYETIQIPDGPVLFSQKFTRQPVQLGIYCTIIEPGKLREIYALVQRKGKLILPDEPDKYYNAILTIDTPQNIILQYHTIVFTAMCEPYAYSIENPLEEYPLSAASWYKFTSVVNNGTAECEPVYIIEATSEFDFWGGNDKHCRIHISKPEIITIDMPRRIVYNASGENMLNLVEGDFFDMILKPGENTVRGTAITGLKIQKNERWY